MPQEIPRRPNSAFCALKQLPHIAVPELLRFTAFPSRHEAYALNPSSPALVDNLYHAAVSNGRIGFQKIVLLISPPENFLLRNSSSSGSEIGFLAR